MASTKKRAKKRAKKPAKKATKKPAKRPPAKKPPAKTPPASQQSDAEKQVAALLKDYEDGAIDNAWDVISDMMELDAKLSKSSSLRPAFDKMFGEIEDICRESAGG